MAKCVGCGLEVNNGILEVNVCGTPVVPNTTTGGLQCDTTTEGGCLKVVLNDSHALCGLKAVGGALQVNVCNKGGILCGPTTDDASNCIYVNVVGQGGGPCVVYDATNKLAGGCSWTDRSRLQGGAAVSAGIPGGNGSACPSPNCNGLVRTCDGLWAPPSIPSINFSCGQLANFARTPMSNFLQSLGNQGPLLAGSSDGFPGGFAADQAFGTSGSEIIIFNAFETDLCNPIDAMSWTAFTMNFEVKPGELWRFGLHERICNDAGSSGGDNMQDSGNCTGNWILQSVQYVDGRGNNQTNVGSVQINDNSTWRFGKSSGAGDSARMEAMITINRLIGTGAADNAVYAADFQYRNMGHGYHHGLNQNCGFTDATV